MDNKGKIPGVGMRALDVPIICRTYRPNGEAVYDPNSAEDCFDEDGNLVVTRSSPEWSNAFLGGRHGQEWANAEFSLGAENEFTVGNRVLMAAFINDRPSFEGLPFEWYGNKDEFTGIPTDFERILFCFVTRMNASFIQRWYSSVGDPQGTIPTNPFIGSLDLRFKEGQKADGGYYLYFIQPHPVHGLAQYWKHGTVNGLPTAEINGYEPGYPEVMGPATWPINDNGSTDLFIEARFRKIDKLAKSFIDSLPTSGGGIPLNKLRAEIRKVLEDIRSYTVDE